MNLGNQSEWDVSYEWKAVLLLSLGFGLVGVDRFVIVPLFPVIMKDLHLDYQDLGHITGALSLSWGLASIFMGRLSDRIGLRKVIIPALILFSLLVGLSGLATGLTSLVLVRVVMGLCEGAYAPASITATLNASKPSRHGRNIGLQQALNPLLGLGLAPIIVTQLLRFVSWHFIFPIVTLPGLVLAFFMWKVLRNTDGTPPQRQIRNPQEASHKWTDLFGYRNIPLNLLNMGCWLTCLVLLSAFLPSYLVDHQGMDVQKMGYVLSAMGFGSTIGTILMPMISDFIGRKTVMVISVIGTAAFLILLINTGRDPVSLFFYLLMTLVFVFGMIALTVGPLTGESVPANLMSSAAGLVSGVGEFIGGALAPVVGGYVAKHFGIQYPMYLCVVAVTIGFLGVLCLKETAPRSSGAPSAVVE
ncbi:MFS transporter [Paraburkholderia sp. B3]|uniref:MFS transporter n=1 Tax=Paraburkholderia sp. B3 TaxID=3134791 RepID=UPI003981FCCF